MCFGGYFFNNLFLSFPLRLHRTECDRIGCVNDMLILLQCYVCFNAKITLNNTMVAPYSDMERDFLPP